MDLGSIGRIETPTMDVVITMASVVRGVDYRNKGLTLTHVGRGGLIIDRFKQCVTIMSSNQPLR